VKRKNKNPKKEESDMDINSKEDKEAQNYFNFVSFLLSQRLSYNQISKIGSYLQLLVEENKLGFLSEFSFNSDLISNIVTKCLRPALLQDIKEELKHSKFSFTIDSSTMVGESLCAVKAKYWTKELDDMGVLTQKLENKIIGLTTLRESSDANTILEIVKNQILTPELLENFVGLSHDNAASEKNGLVGLLKRKSHIIFMIYQTLYIVSI